MVRKAANIVFLLGLIPWALVFFASAMLFDAPGSESSPLTLGLFYAIGLYPVLVVVGLFLGSDQPPQWRRTMRFLPLASPVAAFFMFMAIDIVCSGKLACA